jgi:hypothetical protein
MGRDMSETKKDIEAIVKRIVREEMQKLGPINLQPVDEFCDKIGINRVTLWKQEKLGKVKIHRIGTRCFVNAQDFIE